MGIPHLISTLEPYAVHQVLRNETVVIDGPALAYHILYICRANGVSQPSYSLLGRAAIAWLDGLQSHLVTIQAIYFDGYLPTSKQAVRMQRMVKSTTQLRLFFFANPKGCSSKHLIARDDLDWDVFAPGRPMNTFFSDPSFLVPAILDALRGCSRYRALCSVVPGEADAYCAAHVAHHGGVVMTSDSDLLAHDLSDGKVVFLRDVHRDADSRLACATFSPRNIYKNLGLPSTAEACRLAYERRRSPHASLANILKACSQSILDQVHYQTFCQQYLDHERAPLPPTTEGNLLSLGGLDPRLSELLLQLGPNHGPEAKIFLPILIESHARGSAWEPSTPIRQLAYTVARFVLPGRRSISVQEYRRVQDPDQKGREISPMATRDAACVAINELLIVMKRAREKTRDTGEHYWTFLCLTLNILECQEQGTYSHALFTLQQACKYSANIGDNASWDLIHFVAQLQAGYYSFRILSQVLSTIPEDELDGLATDLSQIRELLSKLPPIAGYPDATGALNFLQMVKQIRVSPLFSDFVTIPDTPSSGSEKGRNGAKVERKRGKRRSNIPGKSLSNPKKPAPGNRFSLLSVD